MANNRLSLRLMVLLTLWPLSALAEQRVTMTGLLTLKCPEVIEYHRLLEQDEQGKGDDAVTAVLEAYLGGMNTVYELSAPNKLAVVDMAGAPYPTSELRLLAFLDRCKTMPDDPAWISALLLRGLMHKTQSQ